MVSGNVYLLGRYFVAIGSHPQVTVRIGWGAT